MEGPPRVKTAVKCPDTVLQAIYAPKSPTKSQDLEESQQRWWRAYSARKMSNPTEEYLANAMVYDPNHLPHSPTKQQTEGVPANAVATPQTHAPRARPQFNMNELVVVVCALLALRAAGVGAVYPSTNAPGGLAPARTPQFVLFTHDDAVRSDTYKSMMAVLEGRQSLDGCPAAATMFTTSRGTDCDLLVDLYQRGNEIADHTVSHPSLLGLSKDEIESEVLGARADLADCGIPISDIVGLRAPYLETKPDVLEVLQENGFLYDSTLMEQGSGRSLSGGPDDRVWPWDLKHGIRINCGFYSGSQKCDEDASYPGLWQVPVWDLHAKGSYTMDYGADGKYDAYEILKANFEATYYGNRAPFPIFIHTYWMKDGDNQEAVERFADYALSLPDVYFVTVRQLIAWMQNPVPADQLTPALLGCGTPGGAGPQKRATFSVGGNTTDAGTAAPAPSPAGVPVPAPEPSPADVPAPEAEPVPTKLRGATIG